MAKDKNQAELERLHTQAESLKERDDSAVTVESTANATEENNVLRSLVGERDETDLNPQLEKLVDALEQELESTNPMTLLIVFALGIIIGRLLPR